MSAKGRTGCGWIIALAMLAAVAGPVRTATAEILLYEDRLPDGVAYVRFANTASTPIDFKPDFTDPVQLGAGDIDRVSPYRVVEAVAGRDFALFGGAISFRLTPGRFHTVLLLGQGRSPKGALIVDDTSYNQTKIKFSFYNATPSCSAANLLLVDARRPIFAAVGTAQMRTRDVSPTATAQIRVECGPEATAPMPLEEIFQGGQYSVWLMRPHDRFLTFMTQDTIAPYFR
jgi:hypothetical protein